MNIYIIFDEQYEECKYISEFNTSLENELRKYGITTLVICNSNYHFVLGKIEYDDIFIIYNADGTNSCNKKESSIILEKALECKCRVVPVAINRNCRTPQNKIEKKQSFDVWEQLRCRNLDEHYLATIAKIFSRKIISMVMPTLYSENGEIFLSHRRIDGEEITGKLYDKILIMAREATPFRDVVNVKVGEEAQKVIDKQMEKSDVFVFIHTPKSGESDWILKELKFALLRNIPILWVKIDDADENLLRIKPSDSAHLNFKSEDFNNDKQLVTIVDDILYKCFELIMNRSMQSLEYSEMLKEIFGENVCVQNEHEMVYHISVNRKGYHYPQRNIEQYYQIYGRTPNKEDANRLSNILKDQEKDSIAILTNRLLAYSKNENIAYDSLEDFYCHWNTYLSGQKKRRTNMEIIISGAFPDADEIYKQSLTDALILFSKAIFRNGYELTFGAHPTFQNLFFEIAKEESPDEFKSKVNMYISNWFLKDDKEAIYDYNNKCTLCVSERKGDILKSLTEMRKQMIQRTNVKALVCLGGKIKENEVEEGIREEIKLAKEANIPVFLVGSVGGCSSKVAEEYRIEGWSEINDASNELNEIFCNDIDYYKMAQEMFKFIDETV